MASPELEMDIDLPDVNVDATGMNEFTAQKAQQAKLAKEGGSLATEGGLSQDNSMTQPQKGGGGFLAQACACLTIPYWSQYFNINQKELFERFKACVNPTSTALKEKVHNKPDLYGPFWICTTLILTLVISESLFSVLVGLTRIGEKPKGGFSFDFKLVGLAMSVVYGAFSMFPMLFIAANKVFGSNVPVIKSASIYGYSFLVFVVASLICIVPIYFIRLLVWMGAAGHSICFLFFNFREHYASYPGNGKLVVISMIALGQIFLALVFLNKFY